LHDFLEQKKSTMKEHYDTVYENKKKNSTLWDYSYSVFLIVCVYYRVRVRT
jgi:hypothetical protein